MNIGNTREPSALTRLTYECCTVIDFFRVLKQYTKSALVCAMLILCMRKVYVPWISWKNLLSVTRVMVFSKADIYFRLCLRYKNVEMHDWFEILIEPGKWYSK